MNDKRSCNESTETPIFADKTDFPRHAVHPNTGESIIAPNVALDMEASQLGKFSLKGGTGFAAEDANALKDERRGRTVERTGAGNAKNGADRIVDGVPIQTKYFKSASTSVSSAFDDETGLYRYKGMQLEVPKDQYEAAVKLMEKRISDGKVPGVTDPANAREMIRQGGVTYRQARNIARAGNIVSLTYDARNGVLICRSAFGLTFAIEFGSGIWRGDSAVGALKNASIGGMQSAGVAFFTSIGSAQLLRTKGARMGTVLLRRGLRKAAKTELGSTTIQKIAQVSLGRTVSGAAAVNHVAKLLRSNAITGAVTVTVLTLPDLYRASISGSASWAQLGKNLVVNATGVAAGSGGWFGGAALGAAAGSFVAPGVGTAVGGFVGGVIGTLGGGAVGGKLAKKVMDYLVEDDAVQMNTLLTNELVAIATEHLLTQKEFDKYFEFVSHVIPSGFLAQLYAAEDRSSLIREHFEEYAFEIIKKREPVVMESDEQVLEFIEDMLERVEAGESLEEPSSVETKAYVPDWVPYSSLNCVIKPSRVPFPRLFGKEPL